MLKFIVKVLKIKFNVIWLGGIFLFGSNAEANDMQFSELQKNIENSGQVFSGIGFSDSGYIYSDFVYGLERSVISVRPNTGYYLQSNSSEDGKGFFALELNAQDFLVWVPLIALIVTNMVSIRNLREASKAAVKKELVVDSLKHFKSQLSEFYDPLNALVSTNYDMFESLGPKTFPRDPYKGEEAADLWTEIVNDVILPNNESIIEIIKTKSHLIDSTDNLQYYFYYVKHAQSYMLFRKQANSLHEKFPYPKDLLGNIDKVRGVVLNKLRDREEELRA